MTKFHELPEQPSYNIILDLQLVFFQGYYGFTYYGCHTS